MNPRKTPPAANPKPVPPVDIYPIRTALDRAKMLGIKKGQLCDMLLIGRSTLLRWESGQVPVPRAVQFALYFILTDTDNFRTAVAKIANPEAEVPQYNRPTPVAPPQRPPRHEPIVALPPATARPKVVKPPSPSPQPPKSFPQKSPAAPPKPTPSKLPAPEPPPLLVEKCEDADEDEQPEDEEDNTPLEEEIPRTGKTTVYKDERGTTIMETRFPKQPDHMAELDKDVLKHMQFDEP